MISTPLTTLDISVIIPTLNEENNIEPLAAQLHGHVGEVIIADGGSTDNTIASAKSAGLRVVTSPAGRGIQLNHGATASSGRILLFLHADTRLPDTFGQDILSLINSNYAIVGTFRLAVDGGTLLLKLIIFFANLRSTYLQLPYGDQGFFLTRENFNTIGGFPQTEVMEDFIFIRKASKNGKIVTLEKSVITSTRRWQRLGVIRTTIINQLMIVGYVIGISSKKLTSLYRR